MLESLALHGFRNLKPLQWSVSAGSHLLLGGNGAGKTSILEAVYLVATTRSFRTSQIRECLQRSRDEEWPAAFSISASVSGSKRAKLDLALGEGGLQRQLDGSTVSLADYLEAIPIVVWSTDEAEIMSGSPDRRRRLLDRGLATEDLARLRVVSGYRRCLRQKRELLRRGLAGLEEWNHLLAGAAAELVRERSSYVERLGAALESAVAQAGLDVPALALR